MMKKSSSPFGGWTNYRKLWETMNKRPRRSELDSASPPPSPPKFNVDTRVYKAMYNLRRISPFKIRCLRNNIEIGGKGALFQ